MAERSSSLAPGLATVRRNSVAWCARMRPLLVDMRGQGLSYAQIADELNQRGIRTQRRARWTPDQVRRSLDCSIE